VVTAGLFWPGRQPGLERLDVTAGDLGQAGDLRRGRGEEAGEAAQCHVGVHHAARPEHAADLVQVSAHRPGDAPGPCRPARPRPAAARGRRSPGTAGGGMAGEDLRVDGLGGLAVLGGQPVIG
jgi:hypothetical protein